jgi:hypothetical protein
MLTITIRRGILLTLCLAATLSMAACSASLGPSSAGPGNAQATTPAAPTTISPAARATATGQGGVQNLAISNAMRSALAAAYATTYAAGLKVPVSELGAPAALPGSIYYAYDPATDTYWALGTFEPTAPDSDPAWYQDGTNRGMFQKVAAGPWQVHITLNPLLCGELRFFPRTVLMAWALPTAPPAGLTC